jgi:putative heme-binding domain-containing protein
MWLAMEPRANVPMPAAWKSIAPALYGNSDARVQREAERLAAAFGDATAFPRLRETLGNKNADKVARIHAFAVLSRALDRESLPVFLKLVDDDLFPTQSISLLARFDAPNIPTELIDRFNRFKPPEKTAALGTLTSRASFAIPLLDAVGAGKIPRDQLTAFHVRQLSSLKDAEVDKRIAATLGRIQQTPAEKQAKIAKLEKAYDEAPLWAYNAGAGREHFKKLCMQCHKLGDDGVRLGPELTGAGKQGAHYFIENIADPDAVIGTDFQMTIIETKSDDVISGLVTAETSSAVTVRTTTGESVIPKTNISKRTLSQKSLMPDGLLDSLNDREQIEMLKYLVTH